MPAFNLVMAAIGIAGVISSAIPIYIIGTEKDNFKNIYTSWLKFSRYFAIFTFIVTLISVMEGFELFFEHFDIHPVSLEIVHNIFGLSIGVIIIAFLISLSISIWKESERTQLLDSSVFYGKFGITLLYVSVFGIISHILSNSPDIGHLIVKISEILYIGFFPTFVYILLRLMKYNTMIKEGRIIVPSHTINVFIGVSTSFLMFFIGIVFDAFGNHLMYNLMEVGSLAVFVLVGLSYGAEMEKVLSISE
ncbi:hypothetical protein [Geoglobus acetivorans]|uniref:Uncharacterized protein n=1 Tax=Geoglobus acetivorans TaxID=565033 RepID=A0A0A7GBF4_GEOAI|nr:hypothetical protein GACE_0323 [Geoglobus acetivorans]